MKFKIENKIREKMPQFFKGIENGEIYHYDQGGLTRDLSDVIRDKIDTLKKVYKFNIVAVIETDCVFPGDERAHMLSYIIMDNDDMPWIIGDDTVCFMALVVNDSWGIEETGSVGLYELAGCVRRKL